MAKIKVTKVDIGDPGGGPPKVKNATQQQVSAGNPLNYKTSLDDDLQVRDAIHSFIARGDTALNNPDARANYSYLVQKLGGPTANNVLTHVLGFNMSTGIKNKSFEDRLTNFYDIVPRDPQVAKIVHTGSQLGQGPIAGALESPEYESIRGTNREWHTK
jgi:hypothetical protein